MNRSEFLAELKKGLSSLPEKEAAERISFYSEMIDDRIEEGLTEEEAVSEVGSVYEIIGQAVTEAPEGKTDKKRKLKAWEIVLCAVGKGLKGAALIGGGICCVGLAIFVFFGCKAVSKLTVLLTKNFIRWLKSRIVGREVKYE